MDLKNHLLGLLPSYSGNKILVTPDQDINDIMKQISDMHKMCAADYDKISSFFWKGNVKDTARFLWDFLKKNVKYSIEPGERQSVKTPAAILATGSNYKSGNDCKHYSLFAAGIIDSLKRKGIKIDWSYRYANYRPSKKSPQHVFVIVKDSAGNEYWIDPVLNSFNLRKPFVNAIDKKVRTMALYKISGYEDYQEDEISGFFGFLKKVVTAPFKAIGKGVKFIATKVVPAIAMLPARQAFLLMIRTNVKSMATNLHKSILQNPANEKKIGDIWSKFGGSRNVLLNAIKKHSKIKPGTPIKPPLQKVGAKASVNGYLFDKYKDYECLSGTCNNTIGAVPAAAAIIAAAAPIVIALLTFLKKSGQEVLPMSQTAIQDISANGGYNEPGVMQIPDRNGQLPPPTSGLAQELNASDTVAQNSSGGVQQYLPYILIGGAALYLVTRKK